MCSQSHGNDRAIDDDGDDDDDVDDDEDDDEEEDDDDDGDDDDFDVTWCNHVNSCLFPKDSWPQWPQVVNWRVLCGLSPDQAQVSVDAWGLKRLMSYGIRRWLSGARAPREPSYVDQYVFVEMEYSL